MVHAFQVLPVEGQNDGSVEDLLITAEHFAAWVERHGPLAEEGLAPVPESNELMRGSYAMIDPQGRFFSNVSGRQKYSPAILEAGVHEAWAATEFLAERFEGRGGRYDW